jgi:hypothetical protein
VYVVTGQDADILRGFTLAAEAGSYTLTGQDAALVLARVLGLDTGSYALNGQDASLVYSGTLLQIYTISVDANASPTVIIVANPVPETEVLVG